MKKEKKRKKVLHPPEHLLGRRRHVVRIGVPLVAVGVDEFEAEGDRALDVRAVHLQVFGAHARLSAALVEGLASLVVMPFVLAHVADVDVHACAIRDKKGVF